MDEDGAQSSPPGFAVIYLPYADDIRAVHVDKIEAVISSNFSVGKFLRLFLK